MTTQNSGEQIVMISLVFYIGRSHFPLFLIHLHLRVCALESANRAD